MDTHGPLHSLPYSPTTPTFPRIYCAPNPNHVYLKPVTLCPALTLHSSSFPRFSRCVPSFFYLAAVPVLDHVTLLCRISTSTGCIEACTTRVCTSELRSSCFPLSIPPLPLPYHSSEPRYCFSVSLFRKIRAQGASRAQGALWHHRRVSPPRLQNNIQNSRFGLHPPPPHLLQAAVVEI
jgi:hypothetical protein